MVQRLSLVDGHGRRSGSGCTILLGLKTEEDPRLLDRESARAKPAENF